MDKRIATHINKCDDNIKKQQLLEKFNKHSLDIDFSSQICYFKTTIFGKQKKMAKFKDKFSYEYILAMELNYVLKDMLKPEIKTVNQIGEQLIKSLKQLDNEKFTIVQLDFKKYFASLSSEYIYNFFIKDKIESEHRPLFEKYVSQVHYCNPGLLPSTLFAEIASIEFRKELERHLKPNKLVQTLSYVDDFLLIFNDKLDKDFIIKEVLSCVKNVFYKKNNLKFQNKTKVHLEDEKFKYVTNDNIPAKFMYLGYSYTLDVQNGKTTFSIGIAENKLKFYRTKIYSIIKDNYENPKLLRQIIYTLTRKVVVKVPTAKHKYVDFSTFQFYKNIKKYPFYVDEQTKDFFENIIVDSFEKQDLALPSYLKDKSKDSGYNLYHNFCNNRCVALSKKFGYSKDMLIKILRPFTDQYLEIMSYDNLSHLFLKNFYIQLK